MFAVITYLLLGVSIASFGPFEYSGFQIGAVFLYVLSVAAFFSTGYYFGSRTRLPMKAISRRNQNVMVKLFRISLVVSTLLMTYLVLQTILSGRLNLSFTKSAAAYVNSYTDYTRNSGSYSLRFLITSLGAFPVFIAEVLGVFYFKKLRASTRYAVIYLFVATILVYTFGGGTQKQFGDLIIYLVSVVIANQASTGRLRVSTLLKVGLLILAGVYVLLVLLSYRYQAIGVDLYALNEKLNPLINYRYGNWIEGALGEKFAFPLVMLSGYLGQGYYGLSLAFEQPFTWTAFAGSSYSVSVILNQFFGAPFMVESSYPYLVGAATGWNESKWHTVFAWLASDLTFPGVVVFMAFVGFLYGRTWVEIIRFRNPISLLVFVILNIGLAYAPANNQLMHSPGGLLTTFGTLILYFLLHVNFNTDPAAIRSRHKRIRR